tara:strand:- start:389 stop:748 length:360 start_codon:yes stop_codon:yes gene_type:complete
MKKDISTSEDVKTLVDAFYNDVKSDPIIGYVFTDVAKVDWEEHLPRMYKFWEFALLGNAIYKGNPMMKLFLNLSSEIKFIKKIEFYLSFILTTKFVFLKSNRIKVHKHSVLSSFIKVVL